MENTRKYKADLYQTLAEDVAEIARLNAVLGERTSFIRVGFFLMIFTVEFGLLKL